MSTHNIHIHNKIRNYPLTTPKYLFSSAFGRISNGLKNEFESAIDVSSHRSFTVFLLILQ